MKELKSLKMCLTERDRQILNDLCDFGFLTARHIREEIFGTARQLVIRRMGLMVKDGLVRISPRASTKVRFSYVPIIEKIKPHVEPHIYERGLRSAEAKPWGRSLIEHEDWVRTIALKARKIIPNCGIDLDHQQSQLGLSFISLNDDADSCYPDLVIRPPNQNPCLGEIELSHKGSERYFRRLCLLLLEQSLPIFYFVKDESIEMTLRNQVRRVEEHARSVGKRVRGSIQYFGLQSNNLHLEFESALRLL